jgi:hypothetical protein
MSTGARSVALAFLSLSIAALVPAQVERSVMTGVVSDPSGNRVPHAKVTANEVTTGLRRQTETTSEGTFELLDLPPGLFSLSFSKDGFSTLAIARVRQVVGQTRTVNATLALAGSRQQTSVTEPLVQLDRVDASAGAPVESEQIAELPLNGRNWATLTSLAPGAIDNGAGDQRTIRFAGHGLDDNNLTLDGVDATAIYNQEQREYMRLNVPLDSIDQFQAQSQNFGADVEGGSAGGQVAVVSPSGTNSFHGSLFEYFRNDALEARTPFNGASPNPFLLNQFGAALGGPVVRNKTFFYADYEGLRQRLDGTQIGLVPSPGFVSQILKTSPALAGILAAYPAGTSPASNPNVWNYAAAGRQVDNEDSGMIRVDQHFSDRVTAFARFNSDEALEQTPTGELTAKTEYDTKYNNGVAELLNVISPALVNEVKFGINQTIYHTATLSSVPFGINVSGFSPLSGASTTDYPSKSFDLIDDASWAKGKHTFKFGFEVRWLLLNQGTSENGSLTYTSVQNFLDNRIGTASYTSVLPLVRQRKAQYWGYVQDQWKVSANLTITAGVRYNFFNVFHAINEDAVPFDFGSCGGYCPRTDTFSHPRYNDFDPRLGIAWSHGDTVLRAGGGIYHTDGQEDDQNLPISNTVDRYSFSNTAFPALSYPLTPFLDYAQAGGLGIVSPRDLDRNRKDDYVASWTASIQQMLPFHIVGTAAYLGNKATDVLTTTYVNLVNPSTGVAPYPAFGPVSWRGNVGNSTFEALQFNARRAFQSGLLLSANYMWSHSINDGSIGGGESDTPQDSFCRACDKASSDDDVRSMFNFSTVYQFPLGTGRRYLSRPGTARALLGDWEISAIGTAQTGLPVNVILDRSNQSVPGLYSISGEERPDYLSGAPLRPTRGSKPGEWINAAAFGIPAAQTFGNLGRNAVRAPGISQLDLGLSKFVTLTERTNLRFRADVFNVFNRAQYGAPNADLSQSNFGVITTTISNYATGRGTPREFQLSAKINF